MMENIKDRAATKIEKFGLNKQDSGQSLLTSEKQLIQKVSGASQVTADTAAHDGLRALASCFLIAQNMLKKWRLRKDLNLRPSHYECIQSFLISNQKS
jgi:hypothetical protein